MQQNGRKWQMIFTGAALVIAILTYFIFAGTRNAATEQTVAPPPPFGAGNYHVMKADTFASLVSRAYGPAVPGTEGGVVTVDLSQAQGARDFFNGNDALLPFRLGDHGFELRYDAGTGGLKARFRIDEQGGIKVPDDVLIKLMEKTVTLPHVDNKK